MGIPASIAKAHRLRVKPSIANELKKFDMSVREIAKRWCVSTNFVNQVALEEGIDLMQRKNVVHSFKKTGVVPTAYKYKPKYYETWVQESMTGDGLSLEWLTKKW